MQINQQAKSSNSNMKTLEMEAHQEGQVDVNGCRKFLMLNKKSALRQIDINRTPEAYSLVREFSVQCCVATGS